MEILQATAQDLVEAIYLLEKCIQDSINKKLQHWISPLPDRQTIDTDIENGDLYLIKDRGVSKGLMALKKELPADYEDLEWKGNGAEALSVHYMLVHPRWLDSAVANEMLRFVEQYAKENKVSSIRIDSVSDNEIIVNSIKAEGFDDIGEYQSGYQKNQHIAFEKGL